MMIEQRMQKVLLLAGIIGNVLTRKTKRWLSFGDGGSATIIESSVSKNEMFFS